VHTVSAPTRGRALGRVRSFRHPLADGALTTVHAAVYERSQVRMAVVAMAPAEPLAGWCSRSGVEDALVGGFFVTPIGTPLGELWIGGARRATTPFDAPWDSVRSCVAIDGDRIDLAGRADLPLTPAGDLLQAGPAGDDREGFSVGNGQFDSDISDGRHPRAALGLDDDRLIAVACDGRADDEAGLSLPELATLMVGLGAREAINLDGGGSTTLIAGGRLLNRPRGTWDLHAAGGRALATALAIHPRAAAQPPAASA
jgi:hypothetical protein